MLDRVVEPVQENESGASIIVETSRFLAAPGLPE
jgi:hypothetical protein